MAICLFAGVRIVSTYSVFNQTFDEPAHIGAGMEWLDRGTYRYDPQHSPMARVAVALGPYLDGLRSFGERHMFPEGNKILATRGTYWRNLSLARAGTLPFLFFTCVGIAIWSRRLFGVSVSLVAALLFALLPPVLAHGALATTDMAATATYFATVWAFIRWLEEPSITRSAVFGFAVGAALLARLSTIPLLGMAMLLIVALVFVTGNEKTKRQFPGFRMQLGVCLAVIAFVLFAGYRFTIGTIHANPATDSPAQGFEHVIANVPLPFPQFVSGLLSVYHHNKGGHESYLLGEYREFGWWNFFLVVLAVKTPLGFLIPAIIGAVLLWRQEGPQRWQSRALIAAAVAVLLMCSVSHVNLGVRHLLPLYPFLAIAAAFACVKLCGPGSYAFCRRLLVISVFVWFVGASFSAHPDYLPYFNELAGSHPERILAESDLDWGQDLHRLSTRLRELNVREVKIRYFGSTDLSGVNLPTYQLLEPYTPATGYVAISIRHLVMDEAKARTEGRAQGPYSWLNQHKPLEKIGSSILLYKL